MSKGLDRRDFIRTTALATAATAASLRRTKAQPSEQVTVGAIGMGRQGMYNMRKFLEKPECRVLAVCDVYRPHLDRAASETGADAYEDFRQILDRRDIDVILISTPDHWHPAMTAMACAAGKDVYVEKPVSVAVEEGRRMVEVARSYDRVVQVGTQQRSGLHFQKAVQMIRDGELGPITAIRTWNFGNSSPDGIGDPPNSNPPDNLNWDLWLGPAPKVPFNPNRFGVGPDRWSTFRYFWDYAGGMMTDWGVHLLDIVQWALDVPGPQAVSASGGKFVLQDNRETPDTLTALYEYPDAICTYENRDCNGRSLNEHGYGIEFYGTDGTLFLDRSGFEIIPEQRRIDDDRVPRMYSMQVADTNDGNYDHVRDFLDCVKSRQQPVSDIEAGHRSTAICHLANISYRLGRKLEWNAETESIPNDDEAAEMLMRDYRSPWTLDV